MQEDAKTARGWRESEVEGCVFIRQGPNNGDENCSWCRGTISAARPSSPPPSSTEGGEAAENKHPRPAVLMSSLFCLFHTVALASNCDQTAVSHKLDRKFCRDTEWSSSTPPTNSTVFYQTRAVGGGAQRAVGVGGHRGQIKSFWETEMTLQSKVVCCAGLKMLSESKINLHLRC